MSEVNGAVTTADVAERVRHYLQLFPLPGFTLDVIDEDVRQERTWWYVPVLPDKQPESTCVYYETLAKIESELAENDNLNVMLIPALPDDL